MLLDIWISNSKDCANIIAVTVDSFHLFVCLVWCEINVKCGILPAHPGFQEWLSVVRCGSLTRYHLNLHFTPVVRNIFLFISSYSWLLLFFFSFLFVSEFTYVCVCVTWYYSEVCIRMILGKCWGVANVLLKNKKDTETCVLLILIFSLNMVNLWSVALYFWWISSNIS